MLRRDAPKSAFVALAMFVIAVISLFYGGENRSLMAMLVAGVTGTVFLVFSIFLPAIGRLYGFFAVLFALLIAVLTIDHARDLPAYLRGEFLVMEGNALGFERTSRGGGMTVIMREGVEFTVPVEELPLNPDIHRYRVHYLPKSKYVVDCYWWRGPDYGWTALCK